MKSGFWTRTLSGAIFVAILVGCTLYSPFSVGALFAIICLLGLLEFYRLCENYDIHPQRNLGIITGITVYLYFLIRNLLPSAALFSSSAPALIFLLLALVYIIELYRKKEKPFLNIATTIFGIIYVAIPFSFVIEVGHFKPMYEAKIILGILFLIWCNDTFAYLTGSLVGKTKLMPRISPGKTWEGFAGGAVFTLVLAYFLDLILPGIRGIGKVDWIVFGVIVFSIGTLGDLIESMLKRSTGVKDSGKIMAGHGGILDRFDSLLFSVPFIYGYLFLIKANSSYFETLFKDLTGK